MQHWKKLLLFATVLDFGSLALAQETTPPANEPNRSANSSAPNRLDRSLLYSDQQHPHNLGINIGVNGVATQVGDKKQLGAGFNMNHMILANPHDEYSNSYYLIYNASASILSAGEENGKPYLYVKIEADGGGGGCFAGGLRPAHTELQVGASYIKDYTNTEFDLRLSGYAMHNGNKWDHLNERYRSYGGWLFKVSPLIKISVRNELTDNLEPATFKLNTWKQVTPIVIDKQLSADALLSKHPEAFQLTESIIQIPFDDLYQRGASKKASIGADVRVYTELVPTTIGPISIDASCSYVKKGGDYQIDKINFEAPLTQPFVQQGTIEEVVNGVTYTKVVFNHVGALTSDLIEENGGGSTFRQLDASLRVSLRGRVIKVFVEPSYRQQWLQVKNANATTNMGSQQPRITVGFNVNFR